MRSRYKIYNDVKVYFITSSIINITPLFISDKLFEIVLDSFIYCQKHKNLFIIGFVIMPNHFHAVISMDDPDNIPDVIRDLKRFTSKQITKNYECGTKNESRLWLRPFFGNNKNNVWQPGYHPESIISEKWLIEKLTYVHNNPVRKGFVGNPEHWKYSSARNHILNDNSLIKLDTDKFL